MTNLSSSANMGWEVAGGKKINSKKPLDVKTKAGKDAAVSKIPRLEGLQPLKMEKSIYDLIRESDDSDDSGDMDELNNNKVKANKQQISNGTAKKEATAVALGSSSPPKQQQAAKKQPQPGQEPLNLLASSMAASQTMTKKKTGGSQRTPEQEFENALSQINLADLEKELINLTDLFPSNWLTVNQNLAIYLNQRFSHVSDFDPSPNHENESMSLLNTKSVDIKLVKLLNSAVGRLQRPEAEKLFESLVQALFTDSNKSPSNHGFKIYIQLVLKQIGASFDLLTYASKFNDILTAHKHRHQRCLIALWALSQIGYVNLSNGLKVWFECMLPFSNTKSSTIYVATYLNALLSHHKVSKDSSQPNHSRLVDLKQYWTLFDLVADKSTLNSNVGKEAALKLRQSFDLLRSLLLRDMNRTPDFYFELVLAELKTETNSPKQDDLLDMLVSLLSGSNSKQLLSKWKQIYLKHLPQSLCLLEHMSSRHLKTMKNIKSMNETLRYFNEHSSLLLVKQQQQAAQKDKSSFYAKSKSNKSTNEFDQLKKFNNLVKQLIGSNFRRASRLSMVLRTTLIIAVAIGCFFYWDQNANKSAYTKSAQVELKKYGLLEPTLKLINSVKNFISTVQNLLAHYIPIYYQKFNQTVTPVVVNAWNVSRSYALLAWSKSTPYRESVIVYVNQGVDFIHENFPYVMKNLISVVQLAINYATTVTNFVIYYLFQGIDFVGMQLLGWKKGDLEKAFVDALKVSLEYLAQLLQKLTTYLNQK